jgi:ribosomal protein S18 acetylase RimI-like enzyme
VNLSVVRIIDLKKDEFFVPQYVELRNHYVDLLLTDSVTVDETKEWLVKANIEVRCFVDNHVLVGVVILYLDKEGEVAFFVKNRNRGIGSQLLKVIEEVAKEKRLNSLWAWVMSSNLTAQKTFTKNGYLLEGETEKKFRNKIFRGFVFRKKV